MKQPKQYRPTRLDHFPKPKGGGDALKGWLEDHGLPVDKDPAFNARTMIRATGGKA